MEKIITKAIDPTDMVWGMKVDGTTFHYPLSEMPHVLIAGTTGSGKSVYINSAIYSCLYHSTPNELQIFIIDPKTIEFTAYEGLPYCPAPPVTNMNDAYGLLQYLVYEMDNRYKQLSLANVKKISEYRTWYEQNPEKAKELNLPNMPYIICLIDEYADMVMQERDVETLIVRLAQKSRACGIHLMIATQRPSVDIISSIVKANIPTRIALKVVDSMNSLVILDEGGAEKLNKHGDSLIKLQEGIVRVQGPFITDKERDAMFSHLREKYKDYSQFIDFKQICVDKGLLSWAEDYDENTNWKDKHVIKPKRSFGR